MNPPACVADCVFGLVTFTSHPPVTLGGVMQLIDVLDETVTLGAGTPPNVTVAPVSNPLPEIVTDVPPTAGPVLGVTEAIVGINGGGLV